MAQKTRSRYARRWRYALPPCLLICFMYCLWGGMEVFTGNAANFRFTYFEAALPLLGVTAVAAPALASLVSLLRKKAFTVAISLLLALAVCS